MLNKDRFLQNFIGFHFSGTNSRFSVEDPTTIGFNLLPAFEGVYSPLFNESQLGESAINYLKKIGENTRAEQLKEFKERFRFLVSEHPYYFQTMKGLGGIYNFQPGVSFNNERVLEFTLNESLDLRISNIIELYRQASFDIVQMREILPGNMMDFKLTIIMSEIRNFATFISNVNSLSDESDLSPINKSLNFFAYDFYNCRMDLTASHQFMEEVSMQNPDQIQNQFRINCGRFEVSSQLNIFDLFLTRNLNQISPIPQSSGQTNKLEISPLGQSAIAEKNKESVFSRVGKKAIGMLSNELEFVRQQAVKEVGELVQVNNPLNIATRLLYDYILNPGDSFLKSLVFGNVFSQFYDLKNFDAVEEFKKTETGSDIQIQSESIFPEVPDLFKPDLGQALPIPATSVSPQSIADILSDLDLAENKSQFLSTTFSTGLTPVVQDQIGKVFQALAKSKDKETLDRIYDEVFRIEAIKKTSLGDTIPGVLNPDAIKRSFIENVNGFTENPIETFLTTIIKGNIGNVYNG